MPNRTQLLLALGAALAGITTACRQDMHDQPKYVPLRPSGFFDDRRSARPLLEDTVARGELKADTAFHTGKVDGKPVEYFPSPVTRETLERGRERFNIYCAPCHDATGGGFGMVVRRGYRRPPSYHIDRLREAPPGYFVDVIANGFGAMPDYAAQIGARDRWAIAAYIRALQLSRHAVLADATAEGRAELKPGAMQTK